MAQFDDWLRDLAAAGKGGITLTARRGLAFNLLFTLPGDWTGATLEGQVRTAPDAASSLSAFTCSTGTYDAGLGLTPFTATLDAGTGVGSTGVLTAAPTGDPHADFVFDLLLTPSGGDKELLFGGVLRLLGKVTA
jgi:hypothetical protein